MGVNLSVKAPEVNPTKIAAAKAEVPTRNCILFALLIWECACLKGMQGSGISFMFGLFQFLIAAIPLDCIGWAHLRATKRVLVHMTVKNNRYKSKFDKCSILSTDKRQDTNWSKKQSLDV